MLFDVRTRFHKSLIDTHERGCACTISSRRTTDRTASAPRFVFGVRERSFNQWTSSRGEANDI